MAAAAARVGSHGAVCSAEQRAASAVRRWGQPAPPPAPPYPRPAASASAPFMHLGSSSFHLSTSRGKTGKSPRKATGPPQEGLTLPRSSKDLPRQRLKGTGRAARGVPSSFRCDPGPWAPPDCHSSPCSGMWELGWLQASTLVPLRVEGAPACSEAQEGPSSSPCSLQSPELRKHRAQALKGICPR